jgi:hypothetical protein
MHSVQVGGGMYLPWKLDMPKVGPNPYVLTGAYVALAVMIYLLSFSKEARAAARESLRE